jgi:hypothetical protein
VSAQLDRRSPWWIPFGELIRMRGYQRARQHLRAARDLLPWMHQEWAREMFFDELLGALRARATGRYQRDVVRYGLRKTRLDTTWDIRGRHMEDREVRKQQVGAGGARWGRPLPSKR